MKRSILEIRRKRNNMKKHPLPPGIKLKSPEAKRVFKGVRFDVYQWKQKRYDGTKATFELIKRADSIIVFL